MKSCVTSILSAVLFVAGVSAQTITLNTPAAAVLCNAVALTWVGGTAPFTITLLDASQGNEVFGTYHTNQSSSFSTPAIPGNITAGDNLVWTILDSTGATGECAPVKVQAGGSGCSSSNSTSPAPASNSTSPAGSTSTTTTPTSSGSVKSASTSSSSSGSKTSTATPSQNAAMPTDASYGAAGILGALVVAVFV